MGEGCQNCHNRGNIYHAQKVEEYINKEGFDLFESYKFLKEYKIFPEAGGALDQKARLLHCIQWVDLVKLKGGEFVEKKRKATADLHKKFTNLDKGSK